MKKIGILTFNNSYNYGAVLQAFATQKFLSNMGNEAEFINYQNEYEYKYNKLFSYRKNLSLKRNIIILIKNTLFFSFWYCNKSFNKFIKSMPKTCRCNSEQLNNLNFDIIIAGSDQIWNPNIYGENMDWNFLLDFNTKAKKISFASSLGSYKISDEYKEKYLKCLNDFYAISVREDFAVKQLEDLGLNNIKKVCDPTMLLSSKEWKNIINIPYKKIKGKKYALVYLMSQYEEYEEQIKKIADFYNLKIVLVSFSNLKRKYVDCYAKSYNPLEFLNILNDAELVLTNSFHGTVFSLLFSKNFFNLENIKNPERVKSLLKQMNLTDRIIKKNDDVINSLKNIKDINYKKVQKEMEKFSKDSRDWLISKIGD